MADIESTRNSRSSNPNGRLLDTVSLSELRYRRLFEAARDGILLVDPETRQIVDVNPFLEEFLGYSRDEFIGKEIYELGRFEDELTSQAAFRELLSRGYIRYEDMPLQTKDGRTVAVEFVSNLYPEGSRKIIQCNVRDISARKLVEGALRQSEERFKLVTRAVSDVIWDWNLAEDNFWWSDAFMGTFGYTTNEMEHGRAAWKSRIHPDDRCRVVDGIYDAVDNFADSWSAEYRFQLGKGGYAFVRDNGCILRDATGTGIRMVGGIRDVTEQRKAELQTVRAQRMESLGTLAGGIAHDLNNVLTPVMLSIELLKSELDCDPGRMDILDTIQGSCRRGADLVRQVLSFTRGLDGQRVPVPMRQLVEELIGAIGESFPRDIKILVQVSNELWPITGDPSQLYQVLLNLAVNARDAMPNGGTLTVAAKNISPETQKSGSRGETAAGRQVLLQVSDTGTGISTANCEHIFEPFFTTKEVGKGTGFGLAIVHAVVKNYGGLVTVDSVIGQGTTFNIYLPADMEARATASVAPYQIAIERGHGELVMIVDDENAIRQITQRTLESFGYRVVTACNGADAVALYAKNKQEIALVITDMTMPVMNGEAVVKEIKRINPSARIIAVSGIDISEEIKAGVNDFLVKPYSAQDMVKMIHKVLDLPLHPSQRHAV